MRVRFMLFSIERASNVNRHFVWIGERLSGIFFKVRYNLQKAGLEISPEKYLTAAFFSALVYGLLLFFLLYALLFLRDGTITGENSVLSLAIGLAFFCVFFFNKYSPSVNNSLKFFE